MKTFIYFVFVTSSFFSSGCTDQYSYKTVSQLENKSDHTVIIKYYENGIENIKSRVDASKTSIIELYVDVNDGTGPGFTAFSFHFDSLVLQFDTGVKLVHYGQGTAGLNPDAIAFTEPRNFFNEANWAFENLSKRKKRLEYQFTYTILQSDFELAK